MKQYVIDDLRTEEFEKIRSYLNEHCGPSEMEGVYWIPLDEEILSDVQKDHKDCRPFYLAVVLDPFRISFELLVRTRNRIRCDCIAYATDRQRDWIIQVADAVFEKLGIMT